MVRNFDHQLTKNEQNNNHLSNVHRLRVPHDAMLQYKRSTSHFQIIMAIIAIDPGASGGFAIRHGNGAVTAHSMPDTEADVVELITSTKKACDIEGVKLRAAVEKVGGFAGEGRPGSRMFKFGFGAGVIEGALRASGIRTIYTRPQEWQKFFSLGTSKSCASKTKWKNKLKAEAQRRFPNIKVTLSTADALLILDYAIRSHANTN